MEQLTKKEEQIMQIFWSIKKGFVKDVIDKLAEPKPPYNTISSITRILEEKGFVAYKAYGKTHEYFPLISKEEYKKSFMKSLVQNYFSNSYQNVVSFFAEEEKINADELREILSSIENNKKGNGK